VGQESLTRFSSFQNFAATLIAEIKGKIILLILVDTYVNNRFYCENWCLLQCEALWFSRYIKVSEKRLRTSSEYPKIRGLRLLLTKPIHKITNSGIPEEGNFHIHRSVNLKFTAFESFPFNETNLTRGSCVLTGSMFLVKVKEESE
jgi:hypothetical protein